MIKRRANGHENNDEAEAGDEGESQKDAGSRFGAAVDRKAERSFPLKLVLASDLAEKPSERAASCI